jgi:hypothetical protein
MTHTYLKCQGKPLLDYQCTLKKVKDRRAKQIFSVVGTSGRWEDIKKV